MGVHGAPYARPRSGGAPGADGERPTAATPRLLVDAYVAGDTLSARAAADLASALRQRVRIRDLWVFSTPDVAAGVSDGPLPGPPWEWRDVLALARLIRADWVVEVAAAKRDTDFVVRVRTTASREAGSSERVVEQAAGTMPEVMERLALQIANDSTLRRPPRP